jgi:hypothetical protein
VHCATPTLHSQACKRRALYAFYHDPRAAGGVHGLLQQVVPKRSGSVGGYRQPDAAPRPIYRSTHSQPIKQGSQLTQARGPGSNFRLDVWPWLRSVSFLMLRALQLRPQLLLTGEFLSFALASRIGTGRVTMAAFTSLMSFAALMLAGAMAGPISVPHTPADVSPADEVFTGSQNPSPTVGQSLAAAMTARPHDPRRVSPRPARWRVHFTVASQCATLVQAARSVRPAFVEGKHDTLLPTLRPPKSAVNTRTLHRWPLLGPLWPTRRSRPSIVSGLGVGYSRSQGWDCAGLPLRATPASLPYSPASWARSCSYKSPGALVRWAYSCSYESL